MDIIKNSRQQREKKKAIYQLIYVICILLAMAFFCNGTNRIAAFIVVGLCLPLALKAERLIAPILFSTVFDTYILIAEGQSIGRYLTIIFLIGVFWKIVFQRLKIKVDFWFISIVLMIVLGFFLSFYGIDGYTSLPLQYVFNLLFFLCLIIYPFSSKRLLCKRRVSPYSLNNG